MTTTGYSTAAEERYRLILEMLRRDFPPPARVVELGAAPGEQSIGFARAGYRTTAVDIGEQSDAWEGVAEGTMEARFQEERVDLVVWNLEQTPYPLDSESFDAVVMTEVFEHLRDYPVTALQESRRILKPNGRLYLTTPNAAYLRKRIDHLLGRNTVASPVQDWIGGFPPARHAREYTFSEMRSMLAEAALEPERVIGRHLHLTSGRETLGARLVKRGIDRMARLRPSLGPAIVVVARRATQR